MKIAIDTRWIFEELSGIPAYTRELVRNLAALDTANAYVLYFKTPRLLERELDATDVRGRPHVTAELFPYDLFSLRSQLALPSRLKQSGVDVYHSTNYMIPFLAFPRNRPGRVKCVTTIHDVIPMVFREHAPRSKKARVYPLYRRVMLEVGLRSDAILTDSDASRTDILNHLEIPPHRAAKVHTICCGVSERFQTGVEESRPRTKDPAEGGASEGFIPPEAGRRTILYVGRQDPYKNVHVLVRAMALLRDRCPVPVALTIAGSPDPRYPEAQRLTHELGLQDRVTWTGYLADDDLVAAYRNAAVLAHPSSYEGFGLQILEAMACGTPVVCTTASSLPEVAGDAALLVPPHDADALATAIQRVLTEPALAAQLVDKGRRQAARFTWQRAAEKTLAVYETLAGSGGNS